MEITEKQKERFFSKILKTDTCWLWQSLIHNNYGRFMISNKPISAHRLSYELSKGKIPTDYVIDHLCKVKRCVNPQHLEAVTRKENTARCEIALATVNSNKTACPKGHLYDEKNTYYAKNGQRMCRKCHAESSKKRYQTIERKEYLRKYSKEYRNKKNL